MGEKAKKRHTAKNPTANAIAGKRGSKAAKGTKPNEDGQSIKATGGIGGKFVSAANDGSEGTLARTLGNLEAFGRALREGVGGGIASPRMMLK